MRFLTSIFSKKPSEDAFTALLEEHLDGLYRVAMRYVKSPAEAEDLVQDTVVRVLRFRHRFEMGTHFKAWLYTVLHHTFVHTYRRRKREKDILEGVSQCDVAESFGWSEQAKAFTYDPEGSYLHAMLSDEVLKALDALPEEFRHVVTLCDLEGLSYKDISTVLDCPVGTVMSRLHRGRKMLAAQLKGVALQRGLLDASKQPTSHAHGSKVFELSSFKRSKVG
jgi:RNA polymerase sigma-70 factor (ECF subfamily)